MSDIILSSVRKRLFGREVAIVALLKRGTTGPSKGFSRLTDWHGLADSIGLGNALLWNCGESTGDQICGCLIFEGYLLNNKATTSLVLSAPGDRPNRRLETLTRYVI